VTTIATSPPTSAITRLAHAVALSWGWRRALIAFGAGALSVLALAPTDIWPVLFLTFPILVWLVDGAAAIVRIARAARLRFALAMGGNAHACVARASGGDVRGAPAVGANVDGRRAGLVEIADIRAGAAKPLAPAFAGLCLASAEPGAECHGQNSAADGKPKAGHPREHRCHACEAVERPAASARC